MSLPVFRKGVWMEQTKPLVDPLWSREHTFQAASFYATAVSQGFSTQEASALSEAYIYKQIYTELQYSKTIEMKIKQIMGRVEKA
jgi:hypothetical protein